MMKRLSISRQGRRQRSSSDTRGATRDSSGNNYNNAGQDADVVEEIAPTAATAVTATAIVPPSAMRRQSALSSVSKSKAKNKRESSETKDKVKKRNQKAKDVGVAVGSFIRSKIRRTASASAETTLTRATRSTSKSRSRSNDTPRISLDPLASRKNSPQVEYIEQEASPTAQSLTQAAKRPSIPQHQLQEVEQSDDDEQADDDCESKCYHRRQLVVPAPSSTMPLSSRNRRSIIRSTNISIIDGESPTKTVSTSTSASASAYLVLEDSLGDYEREGIQHAIEERSIDDEFKDIASDVEDENERNGRLTSLSRESSERSFVFERSCVISSSEHFDSDIDDVANNNKNGSGGMYHECLSSNDSQDALLMFSTSTSMSTSSSHSNKSYSKHREELILESQRAIQRKQNQATRHTLLSQSQNEQEQKQKKEMGKYELQSCRHQAKDTPATTYNWSFLHDDGATSQPASPSKSSHQAGTLISKPIGITDMPSSSGFIQKESYGRSRSLSRTPKSAGGGHDIDQNYIDHEDRSIAISSDETPRRSKSVDTRATKQSRTRQSRQRSESPSSGETRHERFSRPSAATSPWHAAILKHDWESVEKLLESFHHTKYRDKKASPNAPSGQKRQKKLRILRFPKRRSSSDGPSDDELFDDDQHTHADESSDSPLLQVDEDGRTPLHLACTQQMPEKLLLKLYFVGRDATGFQDSDGRYPIHLALIHNLSTEVLERLIHSHAASLGTSDKLHHTPMQYAIRKASRLNSSDDMSKTDRHWSAPTTFRQIQWQARQTEAWGRVKFLLDEMTRRRKVLSVQHEKMVVLQAIDLLGPPSVIESMLDSGERLFFNEQLMSMKALVTMLNHQYPLQITKRMMKIAAKCLPPHVMARIMRNGVVRHLEQGLIGLNGSMAYGHQLLSAAQHSGAHEKVKVTNSCKEWWTKLRFLICYSSRFRSNEVFDENLLSAALTIPLPPPSLIVFLCRLMPPLRYAAIKRNGMLPLHLFCAQKEEGKESVQILKALIGSDSAMVKARSKVGRLPLHYAVVSNKTLSFVEILLAAYRKAAFIADPVTGFFSFQLSAINGLSSNDHHSTSLDANAESNRNCIGVSFILLKAKPHAIAPHTRYGSGDPTSDVTKLRKHVLNWCYNNDESSCSPVLNTQRTGMLRDAIEKGRIANNSIKRFLEGLKSLIWTAYYDTPLAVAMPLSEENLLLAALAVADQIPPIVIELILELYPQSAYIQHPGNGLLPLHTVARSPSYAPLPFEVTLSMDLIEMVALSNPDSLSCKSKDGSLPLHIAIASGKSWDSLRSLVQRYPKALLVRDPRTRLLPFELAACRDSFVSVEKVVQRKTVLTKWSKQSTKENGRQLRRIVRDYQLSKLTTIYSLLRYRPGALS